MQTHQEGYSFFLCICRLRVDNKRKYTELKKKKKKKKEKKSFIKENEKKN